jgi:septum formation protein
MLECAGIPVEVHPAAINERQLELSLGPAGPRAVALHLARAKAETVAAEHAQRLVVGADQTLSLEGRLFNKPADRAAARSQLETLRGRRHELHSAVAVVRDGALLYEHSETAGLIMRDFSARFLENYLDAAGPQATESVGGYQLERIGVHLFERIEGDFFTILGMPLLALLSFLRREGCLA